MSGLDVKVYGEQRDFPLRDLSPDVSVVSARVLKAAYNPNYGAGRGALFMQLIGSGEENSRFVIMGNSRYQLFMNGAGADSSSELEGRGVVCFYEGEVLVGVAPNPVEARL